MVLIVVLCLYQAQEITTSVIPPPTVDTEVTIILTDVNDETPTFRSSFYEAEITENAQVNVPVDFVGAGIPEVYDHDLGKNGTFNLYLIGDNSIFEVTPAVAVNDASFLIRVKNPSALDYERVKQIKFQVCKRKFIELNMLAMTFILMFCCRLLLKKLCKNLLNEILLI